MATIDIRPGDIVLERTPLSLNPLSWLSWCIRQAIRYGYNHVAVCVQNGDYLFLCEAVGSGVVAHVALPHLEGKRYKVLRLKTPLAVTDRAFAFRAMSLVDRTKYSLMRLLVFQLWRHLAKRWALSAAKSKDTTRMICSEYGAWALGLEGWEQYSPEDFERRGLFDVAYVSH